MRNIEFKREALSFKTNKSVGRSAIGIRILFCQQSSALHHVLSLEIHVEETKRGRMRNPGNF